MKRLLLAVLFLTAAPAFAINNSQLVDDVIRMTRAGVGEEEILAYVRNESGKYDIGANDVIAMSEAKVTTAVIKSVIAEARDRIDVERGPRRPARSYYVGPSYGFYDPWYDPFWHGYGYGYGPRFSVGIGFGPRWYRPYGWRRW